MHFMDSDAEINESADLETVFAEKQTIWGFEPTLSAIFAKDYFVRLGIKNVLIPGVGYGRNAKLFIEHGMSVTGIEISKTAISGSFAAKARDTHPPRFRVKYAVRHSPIRRYFLLWTNLPAGRCRADKAHQKLLGPIGIWRCHDLYCDLKRSADVLARPPARRRLV